MILVHEFVCELNITGKQAHKEMIQERRPRDIIL